MALVKTYKHPTIGCTISIYDDACQCSEAEMARRRASFDRKVFEIMAELKAQGRLPEPGQEDYRRNAQGK